MNKQTFEDYLNKWSFSRTINFLCDAESKTLKTAVITEHGQEYYDEAISNFINNKLQEMIDNPSILKGFYPLERCFEINDRIAANVADKFYELCIKHCGRHFEERNEALDKEFDKPHPYPKVPDFNFPYVFQIIKDNRQYFTQEQIQALFDSVVDVIDKRGTPNAYSKLIGIKTQELNCLISIIRDNPFLNTENLQRVVIEKPQMRCYIDRRYWLEESYEAALLRFAQVVNADANPYINKLITETADLNYVTLAFLGFGKMPSSMIEHPDGSWNYQEFQPITNIKPEYKEYCRDLLLLEKPKIYERLIEMERNNTPNQHKNKNKSKISRLKSFFRRDNEQIL